MGSKKKLADHGIVPFGKLTASQLAKYNFPKNLVERVRYAISGNPWLDAAFYLVPNAAAGPLLAMAHPNRETNERAVLDFQQLLGNGEIHPMLWIVYLGLQVDMWDGNQRLTAMSRTDFDMIFVIIEGADEEVAEHQGAGATMLPYMRVMRMLTTDGDEATRNAIAKAVVQIISTLRRPGASHTESYRGREVVLLAYYAIDAYQAIATRWPTSHTVRQWDEDKKKNVRVATGLAQKVVKAAAFVARVSGMDEVLWEAAVRRLLHRPGEDDSLYKDTDGPQLRAYLEDNARMAPIDALRERVEALQSDSRIKRDGRETGMYFATLDALWRVHVNEASGPLLDTRKITARPNTYLEFVPTIPLTLGEVPVEIAQQVVFEQRVPRMTDSGPAIVRPDGKVTHKLFPYKPDAR